MHNVSFTSNIRLVSFSEFYKQVPRGRSGVFVDEPWTVKESVLKDEAYTKNVLDCTVCGFTDGKRVLLMHICPTEPENKNFSKIEKFMREKLEFMNKEHLQGFLLGSKQGKYVSKYSTELFDKFSDFMKKMNIPYSKFKGGRCENHVMYSAKNDEWIIGNDIFQPCFKHFAAEDVAKRAFDVVEVSPEDKVIW